MLSIVAKSNYFIPYLYNISGRLLLSSLFVLSIYLSIDNIRLMFEVWFRSY